MLKLRQKTLTDQKRRELYNKVEITRNLYNAIIHSTVIPPVLRVYAQEQLMKLDRDSSYARIRNRCIITSRAKGVIGDYNINRIKFRELVQQGRISGVQYR